jgi:hypothetical protein
MHGFVPFEPKITYGFTRTYSFKLKNFFSKLANFLYIGVILCGESIASIPEV